MSYFPPPYSPPMGEFDVGPLLPPDMLRPARQASILFFVLAGLALAGGALFFMSSTVPIDDWPPQQRQRILDVAQRAGWSVRACFIAPGMTLTIIALILGALGMLVRSGRRSVVIVSMIVDGLMLLVLTGMIASSLRDPEGGVMAAVFAGGIGAVMLMLLRRLSAAEKAARSAGAYAAYYQAQTWQQAQPPFDPSSGYGFPLPPPPSQPPPPTDKPQT
jgi:hypothetical protein